MTLLSTARSINLGTAIIILAVLQVFVLPSKLYTFCKHKMRAEVRKAVNAKMRKALEDERARTNDNYYGSWR